jgi:sec-independent protein translocase protein TatA
MLAFIDSPVQIAVGLVVLLIVFGPQKLPEIGQQLGKAIRELKRSTQEFSSIINTDDYNPRTYDPPPYNDYSSSYAAANNLETPQYTVAANQITPAPSPGEETQMHGDFAASAMADTAEDYGVARPPDPS